jgi:hypothetical protein
VSGSNLDLLVAFCDDAADDSPLGWLVLPSGGRALPSSLEDMAVGPGSRASAYSGRAVPSALEPGRAVPPALPPVTGVDGR